MTRFAQYVDVLQPRLLVGLVGLGVIFFFLSPSRRLPVAIAISIPWLTAGFAPDLGVLAIVAKATSLIPSVLIGLAAIRHPGGRSHLPRIAYIYPFVALASLVFMVTTEDALVALVVQVQWFIMSVAALLVVRTIVDLGSLILVVRALVLGSSVVVMASLVGLFVSPELSMGGYGRLVPFGANPNHLSVVFPVVVPLALFLAIWSERKRQRTAMVLIGVAAVVVAVLAGSRGALLATAISSVPLAMWVLRRRSVAMWFVVAVPAMIAFVANVPLAAFGRLFSLDTGRYSIAELYISSIQERPITGLLMTRGLSAAGQQDLGWAPHNSFLYWLYLGGISLAVPMIVVAAMTIRSAYGLTSHSGLVAAPSLLLQVLFTMSIGTYFLAMSTGMLFYPTNAWAFAHLVISMTVLKLWKVPPRGFLRTSHSEARVLDFIAAHPERWEVGK